jgi:hypothetical protein
MRHADQRKRSEVGTICRPQARPLRRATENGQLVPQHKQLDLKPEGRPPGREQPD